MTRPHSYLSTACLHGEHDYCKSNTGHAGAKTPAQCKFCGARCWCSCHGEDEPTRGAVVAAYPAWFGEELLRDVNRPRQTP